MGRSANPRFVFVRQECQREPRLHGALLQLNAEGRSQDILLQTLEQAIESAYRRNAEAPENVVVKIDPETGEISVFREYEVVAGNEEVTDPELQKTVAEANEIEEGPGSAAGSASRRTSPSNSSAVSRRRLRAGLPPAPPRGGA